MIAFIEALKDDTYTPKPAKLNAWVYICIYVYMRAQIFKLNTIHIYICITFQCVASHNIALHDLASHCITVRYITLHVHVHSHSHYITLPTWPIQHTQHTVHYTLLQYIPFHYRTCNLRNIHTIYKDIQTMHDIHTIKTYKPCKTYKTYVTLKNTMPCHAIPYHTQIQTCTQTNKKTDRRTDGPTDRDRQTGQTDIDRRTDGQTDRRPACMHASNMHKYAEECNIHLWSGKFSGCVQCATQCHHTLRRLWRHFSCSVPPCFNLCCNLCFNSCLYLPLELPPFCVAVCSDPLELLATSVSDPAKL